MNSVPKPPGHDPNSRTHPHQPTNPMGSGHPSGALATGPQALREYDLKKPTTTPPPPAAPNGGGTQGSSRRGRADTTTRSATACRLTRAPGYAILTARATTHTPNCTAFRTLTIQPDRKSNDMRYLQENSGGETGIRTLGSREGSTVFETAPFDHSGTSPRGMDGACNGLCSGLQGVWHCLITESA